MQMLANFCSMINNTGLCAHHVQPGFVFWCVSACQYCIAKVYVIGVVGLLVKNALMVSRSGWHDFRGVFVCAQYVYTLSSLSLSLSLSPLSLPIFLALRLSSCAVSIPLHVKVNTNVSVHRGMSTSFAVAPAAQALRSSALLGRGSEGGMIGLELKFSIRAFRACPLVEIRQAVPCRAIRGNSISVNSTLPPL